MNLSLYLFVSYLLLLLKVFFRDTSLGLIGGNPVHYQCFIGNGAALIAMAIICKLIRSSYLNLSYILVIETFVKDKLFESSGKYDSIPRW